MFATWLTGITFLLFFVVAVILFTVYLKPCDRLILIQRDVKQILYAFDALCTSHGIRYWACGGTLLGAVREQDMIAWDDDGDVCIPAEDYEKLLCIPSAEWSQVGIQLVKRGDSTGSSVECRLYLTQNRKSFVDVFVVHDHLQSDRWTLKNPIAYRRWPDLFFFKNNVELDNLGRGVIGHHGNNLVCVNIPTNPYPLLERFFGEDWRTPKFTHAHHFKGIRDRIYDPIAYIAPLILLMILGIGIFLMYRRQKHCNRSKG